MTEAPGDLETPAARPVAMRRTPLYAFHLRHHGQMVPFAGWEMPLHYGSIMDEHRAVRSSVGLFDVSHMGILSVRGATAPALLSRRTTANVANIAPGQCRYTFLLDATGETPDDLIITRVDEGVAEAPPGVRRGTRTQRAPERSATCSTSTGGLTPTWSVSTTTLRSWPCRVRNPGPRSNASSAGRSGASRRSTLPTSRGIWPPLGRTSVVGPTNRFPGGALRPTPSFPGPGYTGELGYELFVQGPPPTPSPSGSWTRACGPAASELGTRCASRRATSSPAEDFHEDRTSLEAGQDRFVEFDHAFVGREALEKQRTDGVALDLVGLTLVDRRPSRGTAKRILVGNQPTGSSRAGAFSPTLQRGIALAYVATPLASG